MYHTDYQPKNFIDKIDVPKNRHFFAEREFNNILQASINSGEYKIETTKKDDHEWGIGGYSLFTISLMKNDKPIIVSIRYVEWETYSDDSTDFTTKEIERTYLIEEDQIARKLFEKIKGLS